MMDERTGANRSDETTYGFEPVKETIADLETTDAQDIKAGSATSNCG